MTTACAAQPRILIADDQPDLLDALRLLLKGAGIGMDAVTSPEAVVDAVAGEKYDLLLMDLNYTGDTTSGREGIDLIARVQQRDSLLPVVVMTGWGSVDLAVETMRRGVCDFVQKPWDNHQLLTTIRAEIDKGRARRQAQALEARELSEARRIQRKLLPATLPQIDGCELAASWQPAAGVGGDCFDAIAFGTSRLGLSIADVVGKGIPAALLMDAVNCRVHEAGECFGIDVRRPPIPHQHRDRGTAAKRFRLRYIRNVQQMDPGGGRLRRRATNRHRRHRDDSGDHQVPRKPVVTSQ